MSAVSWLSYLQRVNWNAGCFLTDKSHIYPQEIFTEKHKMSND